MSEAAKIKLIGKSRESLLAEIASIKAWDNGHDYQIVVIADTGKDIYDSIENVESAIKGDLVSYLEKNFGNSKIMLKSGGCDDLYFVKNYDYYDNEGHFKKIRREVTNYTPPKKKRKKHRK